MRKMIAVCCFTFLSIAAVEAQTYFSRNGVIGFYSKTPLEDIKAENKQVYCAIDPAKKTLAFTLLLKGFLFEKQLMQDHFNENYVESDKYPKATFTGNITGDLSMTKAGVYPVQVKGQLVLHGVTKAIEIPARLEVQPGKITGKAQFAITPQEYNISIPAVVRDKIAKQITVSVFAECAPTK